MLALSLIWWAILRNTARRLSTTNFVSKRANPLVLVVWSGSGRMEKGVDQVIGRHQKGKGMSWTKAGTRALALLTCAELNARPAPVKVMA